MCGQRAGLYGLALILAQTALIEFFGEPLTAMILVNVESSIPNGISFTEQIRTSTSTTSGGPHESAMRISLFVIIGTTAFFSEKSCSIEFLDLKKVVQVSTVPIFMLPLSERMRLL